MAAPREAESDSDSSSSDAEELARCREAAKPAWGLEQRPMGPENPRADRRLYAASNQLPATKPSLRHKVDEHEQDANELQTTPEFRAHVAKKLGALLDSSITILEVEKEPRKAKVQKAASEDDGFRLFFTSIPGSPEKQAPSQPRRKRPPSSSSSEDSDEEWQRCQEAAVSASDILQKSAIHSPVVVEKEVKKRKKKATDKTHASSATATASRASLQTHKKMPATLTGDSASHGTKKKKKAKTSEPAHFQPSKSTATVLAN
ncbi:PREDICTED: uncharacterized protein C12orf43 homolog [Chrysochloris asiatica]|uniref:Protein CUSTOS n=1 Tax=Chrysochloris asiatica TaxID=185453 RepID=A0A9B0WSF3_CHRAS|nr:PREDICTED: uncharacterized protein C12orf43 homolog [Chrysochloris asiatica]